MFGDFIELLRPGPVVRKVDNLNSKMVDIAVLTFNTFCTTDPMHELSKQFQFNEF